MKATVWEEHVCTQSRSEPIREDENIISGGYKELTNNTVCFLEPFRISCQPLYDRLSGSCSMLYEV